MHDRSMTDGYDPDFLGTPLPLPRPAQPSRELPYPRFTVLLDPARRLAAVTAVNIDGARLRELPRTGEWRLDPRIPADEQTGPAVYARNDLDRGHLVRRRDPGWGELSEARSAAEATFFYPNAAPQAAAFNQSKELWLGLEDHVLAYAETTDQRVSVFTAPILADTRRPTTGGVPHVPGARLRHRCPDRARPRATARLRRAHAAGSTGDRMASPRHGR